MRTPRDKDRHIVELPKGAVSSPANHLLVVELFWHLTIDFSINEDAVILIRGIWEEETLCGEIDNMAITSKPSKDRIPDRSSILFKPYTLYKNV
jgi:hypothetical protein